MNVNFNKNIRVLLGGIGDDSHSIGSTLIKIALEECGYNVNYLGIHNKLMDFVNKCNEYDVVMISCINGHSVMIFSETNSTNYLNLKQSCEMNSKIRQNTKL